VINAFVVFIRGHAHVIARLKIANLYGLAGSADVFGRPPSGNRGNVLVVGLNNDIFVINLPQHPVERGRRRLRARPRLLLARRITPSRVSLAGVSAAGVSDTGNDLANTRNGT
jgi:hypothetical protein